MPEFDPSNPVREHYDADHNALVRRIEQLFQARQASGGTPSRTPGTVASAAQATVFAGGSGGSSASVTLAAPSFLAVSGSPGNNLAISLASQSANKVFAAPNGSSGTPTFRSLVRADFSSNFTFIFGGYSYNDPTGTPASVGATVGDLFTSQTTGNVFQCIVDPRPPHDAIWTKIGNFLPWTVTTSAASQYGNTGNQHYRADATAGAISIGPMDPSGFVGYLFEVTKIDSSANAVTVVASVVNPVLNGPANALVLKKQWDTVTLRAVSYGGGPTYAWEVVSSLLTGDTPIVGETPSGTIDGVNAAFTLAHTPVTGSVAAYAGTSTSTLYRRSDITVVGAVVTFGTAPPNAGTVLIDYRY